MNSKQLDLKLILARMVWVALFTLFVSLNVCAHIALYRIPQNLPTSLEGIMDLRATGFTTRNYWVFKSLMQLPIPVVWSGLGLLIFLRKSRDFGAMVISIMMVGFSTLGIIPLWQAFVTAYPEWQWIVLPAAFIGNICLYSFFFVFPTGRYVPRWTIILTVVLSIYNILNSYGFILPPSVAILKKTTEAVFPVFFILFLASFLVIPVYRFRYISSPIERVQIRWVVFTIVVAIALFAATASTVFLIPNSNPEQDISFTFTTVFVQPIGWLFPFILIAISITISILRFHLFDIDLIIRRTLLYALLTGLLGLVYFGSIALLQGLLTSNTSQLQPAIIVATTLAIAALFNPLRRRLQYTIDRRFYRQKYDAEKALAEFATITRSETNLPALATSLVGVVQETVQPEEVKLWLKLTKS